MDVYAPLVNSKKPRPTVVLCFGGGFYWGDKNNYPIETICNRLAQMGFVAVSIDYRTRWKTNQSEIDKGGKTLYRAVLDLNSALSYIENQINNDNPYSMDGSKLFIGGNSSGAITCLNYHFVNANSSNIFSSYKDEIGACKKSNIEPIGIINMCGAMSDTNLITKRTPILSIHGDEDNIVPYQSAVVDFKVPLITTFPKVKLEGSFLINQRTKNIGASSYLYTYKHQRHSPFDKMLEPKIYQPNMDVAINLIRNFLYNQMKSTESIDMGSNLHVNHTSECSIETAGNEWYFYPVDKTIKKIYLKVEDATGKKILRRKIRKKLKKFNYQPKLKSGDYTLKVGYGTFQKTVKVGVN